MRGLFEGVVTVSAFSGTSRPLLAQSAEELAKQDAEPRREPD